MRHWVLVISSERFAAERLYAFDELAIPIDEAGHGEQPGDLVVLVVDDQPAALVALARVSRTAGDLVLAYARREFDDPILVTEGWRPGLTEITAAEFATLAAAFDNAPSVSDPDTGGTTAGDTSTGGPATSGSGAGGSGARAGGAMAAGGRRATRVGLKDEWFVSVVLPIEASSRAEAVREFWTYVEKLGPRELPALVWPRGDELAMQAFVQGVEANQDPEEDD